MAAPALGFAGWVVAHGDVAPQPVDTASLPDVGEEWLTENPYRSAGEDVWSEAIAVASWIDTLTWLSSPPV